MSSEDDDWARMTRLLKSTTAAAVQYKSQFHTMQEEIWRLETLYLKFKGRYERQKEYIAELEHKLGIDDAL